MEQTNNNAPFLLVQKPQELIRLFEGLIDQKIKEVLSSNVAPPQQIYTNEHTLFYPLKRCKRSLT